MLEKDFQIPTSANSNHEEVPVLPHAARQDTCSRRIEKSTVELGLSSSLAVLGTMPESVLIPIIRLSVTSTW